MKRLVVIILAVILAVPVFQSCKKGPNDPSISLASRKSRLVGEWYVVEGTRTYNSSGTVTTYKWDDGTFQYSTGGTTTTGTYIFDVSILKDGSYEMVMSWTMSGSTMTFTYKGEWYFLGPNKNLGAKDKECLALRTNSYSVSDGTTTDTYTYEGADPQVYFIDELKSKEMILKYEYSNTAGGNTMEEELRLIPQ